MNSRIPPGSIALVTGSCSGLGPAICVELARRGLSVVASMADLDRAGDLDAAVRDAGLSCDKVRLDVADPDSIAAAIAEVQERRGPIDVAVNNAGYGLSGFVEDVTMSELREQFETNFFGLVAVTKAVLPGMRERHRGRIINISSASGRLPLPGLGAYVASQFAVEGISESLRHELAPHGVYVSLITPGQVQSDLVRDNRRLAKAALDPTSPNYDAAQRALEITEKGLAGSSVDPAEVASAVAMAATSERPKLRYAVGTEAIVATAIKGIVPFGWLERAIGRVTGLE